MFTLRQTLKCTRSIGYNMRGMASAPLVNLTVDNDGIAIMTLQRPPVNSLNLDILKEISKSIDEVAKNKSKGMILTSASPTVFSAGLDIMEMYKPDVKRAQEFWSSLQDVWIKLYGSGFPTAAAINGHSPAGGCLLAMCCEWRAMVSGKNTIGLNETALGIMAPTWFMETMYRTIPMRQAELALTFGTLFPVNEALKIGLIDEIASDKDDAINKCKSFLKKFDKIPVLARSATKQRIRADPIKKLLEKRQDDINEFVQFITNPKVQQSLDMYIQALKKKSSA